MTHLDTFDPKPGHGNQGTTRVIPTNVDGIRISEYLPSLAAHADKMAIVNSLTSTAGAHQPANYLMHTSYEERATIRHPGVGAWLLKFNGRINPNLPGSVFIGSDSRNNGGGGFFEPEYEPLAINDPAGGLKNSKVRGMNPETFEHRLELANRFDAEFQQHYDLRQVRAYKQMYDEAVRIMASRDLAAFDLSKESEGTREAYGDDPFGQGCLLARRLIEHDVRAVEVSFGGWDMHNNVFVAATRALRGFGQSRRRSPQRPGSPRQTRRNPCGPHHGVWPDPRINQNAGRDHYPQGVQLRSHGRRRQGRHGLWQDQ